MVKNLWRPPQVVEESERYSSDEAEGMKTKAKIMR